MHERCPRHRKYSAPLKLASSLGKDAQGLRRFVYTECNSPRCGGILAGNIHEVALDICSGASGQDNRSHTAPRYLLKISSTSSAEANTPASASASPCRIISHCSGVKFSSRGSMSRNISQGIPMERNEPPAPCGPVLRQLQPTVRRCGSRSPCAQFFSWTGCLTRGSHAHPALGKRPQETETKA